MLAPVYYIMNTRGLWLYPSLFLLILIAMKSVVAGRVPTIAMTYEYFALRSKDQAEAPITKFSVPSQDYIL